MDCVPGCLDSKYGHHGSVFAWAACPNTRRSNGLQQPIPRIPDSGPPNPHWGRLDSTRLMTSHTIVYLHSGSHIGNKTDRNVSDLSVLSPNSRRLTLKWTIRRYRRTVQPILVTAPNVKELYHLCQGLKPEGAASMDICVSTVSVTTNFYYLPKGPTG
jgi:hypothetical protein